MVIKMIMKLIKKGHFGDCEWSLDIEGIQRGVAGKWLSIIMLQLSTYFLGPSMIAASSSM